MTREATLCEHLVAGRMPEQVVDFLEAVEIEAEHRRGCLPGVRRRDLLVDAAR